MNPEPDGVLNGAWMPTAVFGRDSGVTAEKIRMDFSKENIDARVFFHPLSSLPMFDHMEKNVVASEISGRAINLPSYHDMSTSDLERVIEVVQRRHAKTRS
jgi:perosamine synthetase